MFICLCLFVGNSLNFSSLKVFHLHYHKIFCTEFIFKIWLFHFFTFWVNHSIIFWLSFFKISIICVAAGSLIIAPKKIIVFFSWLFMRFSVFSFFSSFILLCLVMVILLLYDGSSFEVWAWRVHFQKLLWVSICIYCLFYLLIWTTVHLASSKWLSD